MAILVTGGAGYIGSHCVQALLAKGRRVVVLDNLSTGFRHQVLTPDFVHADIADEARVIQTLREYRVTAVMHFAASCYVGESVSDPAKYYRNNVCGTLSLLSAMREAGVSQMIFSSSCATYGMPQRLPLEEDHPQEPMNPYGASKKMAESLLRDFGLAYGLRFVVLRYFNAAGADPSGRLGECHEPETHLIPLILQAAHQRRSHVPILGDDYDTPDGTCIRDYLHVADIAQAHVLGLDYLEAGGVADVFNLGAEQGYSVRQVIEACQQVTGVPIPVTVEPRRPGDPPVLVAQAAKARRLLGWTPRLSSLDTILNTAWQWERSQGGEPGPVPEAAHDFSR